MESGTEIKQKKDAVVSRLLKLLIKIGVTVLCFWYISVKIDFGKTLEAVKTADWLLLVIAVLIYFFSKITAAYRLNIYFKNIGLYLSNWKNGKLYWLGMFYNLFLPGSISGDAYKVVLLNRKLGAPYKKTGAAVLLDRFSGLQGLGVLLCIYGMMVVPNKWFDAVLLLACVLSILIFYVITRKYFKEFLSSFWTTVFLGLLVQAIQAIGLYFILTAIHIPANHEQWLFIFLTASVVSVLPLSLGGGLGTREVVFAEGAGYFHLDPHVGVLVSLLFYLTSVAGSLPGAYFIFHDPIREKGK